MKILLLGGTAEARALAHRLDRDGRIDLTVSLAGVTRTPLPMEGTLRFGGFGGQAEQEKFINNNGFYAVIDATHPFAARISWRTAAICHRLSVPFVQLLRPAWSPEPADTWHVVQDEAGVAAHVAPGACVFLGTGPGSLAAMGALPAKQVLCRRIDPPEAPFPFANGEWLVGRPPFSVEDEVVLFHELHVDLLVTKNAGGEGGWAKVEAARVLGLPVVMIDRPAQPPVEQVGDVQGVIDWVDRL